MQTTPAVSPTLSSTSPLFDAADDASSTPSISDSGLLSETLLAGVDATFFAQTRSQTLLFYVVFFFPRIFKCLLRSFHFCKADVA
jgi:hypothetical protein